MRRSPTSNQTPGILLVHPKKFRLAGTVHILSGWANAVGLTIRAVAPDVPFRKCTRAADYEMVILDVCGDSLVRPHQQALMRQARECLPKANLIIISDREELEEVCSAFRAGAAGFMPSSIDPAVALEALSFIRSGGSFFPPSVLNHVLPNASLVGDESLQRVHLQPHRTGSTPKLSGKQEAVFKLLRQGLSNKAIARQLNITEATVKVHVRSIMRKFGVLNRTQVAIAGLDQASPKRAANG